MLANPDIEDESLPDFVLENVPLQTIGQGWSAEDKINQSEPRTWREHRIPHYHHSYFLEALEEFDALLAEKYNGHACIEFMDTYMHGFWGEGHTWPFEDVSLFPDHETGVETWLRVFVCTALARPWQDYYTNLEGSIPEGWYAQYDT